MEKISSSIFTQIWISGGLTTSEQSFVKQYSKNGKNHIEFENVNIEGDINISNTGNLSCLILKNSKASSILLSSIETDLIVIDSTEIDYIYIYNNAKINSISIYESKIEEILFESNAPNGEIFIGSSVVNTLSGIESSIKKVEVELSDFLNINIAETTIIGPFKIINSRIVEKLVIKRSSAEYVQLIETYINNTVITHPNIERIDILHKSFIRRFRCRLLIQRPSHLSFNKSVFEEIDFSHTVFPDLATMQATDCVFNEISFINFCNFGTIIFSDLEPFSIGNFPSILRFQGSDLGKLEFINCILSKFDIFEFQNTRILDIFLAGSTMPRAKSFQLPINIEGDIEGQKRLAYGQLKKVYELQGDTASSLKYLAYEMDAYWAQLTKEATSNFKEFSITQKWDNRSERFILWLNKISTNYGNNWLKGAITTLCVSCSLFTAYCFSIGYRPGSDLSKFLDLASHSLEYLNPFRDEDSGELFSTFQADGMEIKWYSRLWDYFSRIVVAYFVYQTIQAFRKLGKSSG